MDNIVTFIRSVQEIIFYLNRDIAKIRLQFDPRCSHTLSRAMARQQDLRIKAIDMVNSCFPVKDAEGCTFPYPSNEDMLEAYNLIKGELKI